MALHLAGVVVLMASGVRAADEAKLIKGITYAYDVKPHQIGDPDHTKLIDGKDDPVLWYPPPPRQNGANIDFDLGNTYRVTRVEVDAARSVGRSRLQNLKLFVEKGAGYDQVASMQDLAGANYSMRLADQPGPDVPPLTLRTGEPMTFAFEGLDQECYKVRIFHQDAYQPGPNWGLTEVRIYGIPVTQQLASKATSPQEMADALTPYATPKTGDEFIFQEGNFDRDPDTELLLANKFMRLVIEPSLGGTIGSLVYQGVEFTQPKNPNAPGGGGGLLTDHVSSQPIDGDWFDTPYQYRVVEKSDERISVRLSGTGKSGSLQYLTFNKTITLWRDRSDVTVDYDIELDQKATVALPFNFWFHSFVGTRKDSRKSDTLFMFVPEEKGIRTLDWSNQQRAGVWFVNPTRGWAAVVDTERNVGLAFGVDYRHLRNIYSWGSRGNDALPTLEWRFNEVSIPDGDAFKTTFTITPFRKIPKPSGTSPIMVGGIAYEPTDGPLEAKVTATVVSTRNQTAAATLRYRVLPAGQWQTIRTQQIALTTDQPLSIAADIQTNTEGTHVFSLIVTNDGQQLLDLEGPVSIGPPSSEYVLAPKVKRPRAKSTKVNVRYISMDYQTPHVKWGRPYHRGKTKALILMDGRYQREVIELAQRIDLDFDSTYLLENTVGESISDYYGKVTVADLQEGLRRLLRDNPDWEVLVMAGHMFRYFTPQQQSYVQRKIKEGAGLVVIEPDHTQPLPLLCPLLEKGERHPRPGQWTTLQEHFITTGIPWQVMPDASEWYAYTVAQNAEVLATVKGDPLLAVRTYGKGRVVAFSYRAGDPQITTTEVGNFAGLTPFMTNEHGTDFMPDPTFKYHEYHHALLAKSILWAAQKEPSLLVEKINATAEEVILHLDNQGQSLKVLLDMTVSDKYGNILTNVPPISQELGKGKKVVAVRVPITLTSGLSLFDVFVRDEQGNVINWASTSVDIFRPAQIVKVNDDIARARKAKQPPPVYRPGSTIHLEIALAGEIDSGLSLAVKTVDGFDRVTTKQWIPVTSNPMKASLTIQNPLNMLLTVRTELSRNGLLLDIHERWVPVELPLPVKPHQGEPTLLGWSFPAAYGLNNYLIPSYFKLLSEMGFNASLVSGRNSTPTSRRSAWQNNMRLQGRGSDISIGGDQSGASLPRPERNPTLLNPEILKRWAQRLAAVCHTPNTFSVQAGDEAPYSRGRDVDYSPASLAAMRKWLKTEYVSLDALNAQWGTDFGTWEQVAPLTLEETKARGDNNYSSWSDHRSWGEIVVARFFDIMGQTASRTKPGSFYGPSGNPGAGAYSGYDYWQLGKTLTGLWAYSGSDELSLWARERTKILKYSTFGGVENQRWRNYGTLFTGTSGTVVCGTQRVPAFDWTDSRAGAGYRAAWIPLKRGIGRAIHEATRTADPIAVHYSRNASRIAHVLGRTTVWTDTRWKIRTLFENCDFDHTWISYEQLEKGQTDGVKAIFLPTSFTLSDGEVATLEKFVKEGGILVGEMGTGIADGHGKMLSHGRLDHLFGINRQDSRILERKDSAVRNAHSLGMRFPEMPFAYLETGLSAASAEVLATAKENALPVSFVNKVGKGLAVYVAFDLCSSYFGQNSARGIGNNPKYTAEVEDFITALTAKVGVTPKIDIQATNGEHVPFKRTVMFTQGDVRYFGILRNHYLAKDFAADPVKVNIRFPAKGYLRELLSEKDHGFTDEVETFFTPTTLLIYSWAPYPIDEVDLTLSEGNVRPGDVLRYHVVLKSSARPSTHTLHMSVRDPDGNESKPYSHNITATAGKASGLIPLALNDKKGTWKIQLKDLTSGRQTQKSFLVSN